MKDVTCHQSKATFLAYEFNGMSTLKGMRMHRDFQSEGGRGLTGEGEKIIQKFLSQMRVLWKRHSP